jgi:Protein of unknown function (DUF4065)
MGLTDLISAVAGYVSDSGGAPTKTKLLKLLYLLDIDQFRRSKKTLTGFDWIFYLYGPWATSYDDALADALAADAVRITGPQDADEGATFVNAIGNHPLSDVFPNVTQELAAKRIIEAWANRPTVELLDYVYFHTAPMRHAERGARLDFNTVNEEQRPPHYFPLKSKLEEKDLKRLRRRFQDAMNSARKSSVAPLDPPPKYDEKYWLALSKLESEPDQE